MDNNLKPNEMKRDENLDVLRGIAIVFITAFHTWRFADYPAKPFLFFFDFYSPLHKGLMGVPIFVIISGYSTFLSHQFTESSMTYLKQRAIKLIPRYYLAIIIWNLIIFFNLYHNSCTLKDNIFHLLLIHTLSPSTFYSISDPLWYLGLQAQLYIVYAPIRSLFYSNLLKIAIFSFIAMCAVNIIVTPDRVNGPTLNLIQRSILSYFFLFLLGYTFAEHKHLFKLKLVNTLILIISLILLFFNQYLISGYGRIGLFFEATLLSIAILGLPSDICEKTWSLPIKYIGKYSYSIFLYNFIFMIIPWKIDGFPGIMAHITFTLAMGILIEKLFLYMSKGIRLKTKNTRSLMT